MPLKPIQNSISSALPSRSLPPLGSTTFACISPHIRSPKLLNRYCWKECLHFLVSIPSCIACVGLSFFFFFFPYGMPSKQSSEGKMNTAHLFLNFAKSSQSGNRKKKRKVLGVIESYFFFCSSSINSQDLWLPSFQNATPFKSYIILPPFRHSLLQKPCHHGILPT